jgi:hypothetical protein
VKPNLSGDESPRWSFMRVRKIRGKDGSVYLWRLYLICTPWFGVMLHRIFREDNQRDLHDHPWNFLSIILRGWYSESFQRQGEEHVGFAIRRLWNWKRAEDRHSIRIVGRAPTWTLVFTGRRRRTWGFWVHDYFNVDEGPGPARFVPWFDYEKLNDA